MAPASSPRGSLKKLPCSQSEATSAKNWTACAVTCSNLESFSTAPASWGRNSISCCRKCIVRPIRCSQKLLASKTKPWPSPGFHWKFGQKLRSCVNRCRTSNERRQRPCAAGAHCVRTVRFWKIHAGPENSGAARYHAFGFLHNPGSSRDRVQREVL